MIHISKFSVRPTSLVSKEDLQKIVLQYDCSASVHVFLSVYREGAILVQRVSVAFSSGSGSADVMLPVQGESFDALWEITDRAGNVLAKTVSCWKQPREWTIYVMISSHTDIGLHNSQYIQRANSVRFVDAAAGLCDDTAQRDENDRYRYTMEGTWFWNNYGQDRGEEAAKAIVKNYIKTGQIGACCGVAGNHIQTYGLEEMCRSTYEKRLLDERWDVQSETLSMIDNNGLPMSMIRAYADAGYRNIIFAPNQWNPLPSTVWKTDRSKHKYIWNTSAGGGGSRIDLRLESGLPMVFNWESKGGERLTVWGCSHYSEAFGFYPNAGSRPFSLKKMDLILADIEENMWKRLELLEKKCPYDVWLLVCYWDDQEPDLYVTDQIKAWNSKWKWPKVRTLGDPNEPFERLRESFGDRIPVLRGDITGGWYQHPLSVPELMSQKFDADRALPIAEKWATVAGVLDRDYEYPTVDFRRAWDALLFNDEHSYGTSGYKGRRVYETWMQHRDWIDKAAETAKTESERALLSIASKIRSEGESIVVFNPTALERTECIESEDKESFALITVPPFGYRAVRTSEFYPICRTRERTDTPPVIENRYYRISFSENGSLCSIFDKELGRELLDTDSVYGANEPVYTKDNHRSFTVPERAQFEVIREKESIRVVIRTEEKNLRAELVQTVTLPSFEKRIDIDNRLFHARDMVNDHRYDRYLYFAFPFSVKDCRRFCHLNGEVAEYAKDVTGHGTDVYMAVNEWCCAENDELGVALFMMDSHITEFDHIHPDKTDFGNAGEGSQIFSYVANDWLQMHTPGGSHLDYRFRYAITSYRGGYRQAGIPQMAERYVTPVATVGISAQNGTLPAKEYSFLRSGGNARLVCLKRADDGKGIIARFYGEDAAVTFDPAWEAERVTVDEREPTVETGNRGFVTYRLGKHTLRLKEREPVAPVAVNGIPAPIGSVYTGLITQPHAAPGEHTGHLYLLWGANTEEDLSHYQLYRSEVPGFVPCDENFVADILPEPYRVARYEDTGLAVHTRYYYRVCAVSKQGICGEMSHEFSGITKEELE
ncbi:MAG: hypothetical protein IJX39_09610 [Clostridia bacterium]|nr:hypothetical protein [Clostridia bacterium]